MSETAAEMLQIIQRSQDITERISQRLEAVEGLLMEAIQ